MRVPALEQPVDAEHPWLGLSPFTEANKAFFFGRDEEIRDLFLYVRDHPLTILYGQSGLGKTSLLGAGLMPKLKVEGFRPVLVRLGYEENDASLAGQLRAVLAGVYGSVDVPELATLWEFFHHIPASPRGIESTPVLILDQFEEIFTLGTSAQRKWEANDLMTQLADLIENRPPEAVQTRLLGERALAHEYEFGSSPVRVVITLREDYLSHLESWKKVMPSLMRNRMSIGFLDGPRAIEAVVRPGRLGPHGRPDLVNEEVGARIVCYVAKRAPGTPLSEIGAVPPLLSLLCDELNRARLEARAVTITGDLVAQQGEDILQNFYIRAFEGLDPAVREYVEDRLVTVGGHRNSVAREDAVADLGRSKVIRPDRAVDQLVQARLLVTEERGGIQRLEITHDVLTGIVVRSRDQRRSRKDLGKELADPDRIGDYRLIHEVGRGGQGTVYLAENLRIGRRVALKVIRMPEVARSDSAFARFRREAEATSRLDHPSICSVLDLGETPGCLWIAMRWVEGRTLAQMISAAGQRSTSEDSFVDLRPDDSTPLSASSAQNLPIALPTRSDVLRFIQLIEKAARGLHFAHEAGVLHRDVKPGNIMITPTDEAVIMDFGLAALQDDQLPTLTCTGDILGTPAYMSPEQLAAHRLRVDRRTDVWSLGVTLFECLTLQRPFEAPTRNGLYQAILTKEPTDPRRLNPAVSNDLRVVIGAALEKDRDRRYQTAFDLAEDLRRIRCAEPIRAKPSNAATRLLQWSRRNSALALALVALFFVLASGLAVSVLLLDASERARTAAEHAVVEKEQALEARSAALAALSSELRAPPETRPLTASEERDPSGGFVKRKGSFIKADEAKKLYDLGVQFFDARVLEEFDEGHVKGAVDVDPTVDVIISGVTMPDVLKRFDRRFPVVVYCNGGDCDSSQLIGIRMLQFGFTTVHVMPEGYPVWKGKGFPVSER